MEFIAASGATKEAVWIRNFITELDIMPSIANSIPLYCDNNGAIAQAKESMAHSKSKYMERKYHVIREIIEQKDIVVLKVQG